MPSREVRDRDLFKPVRILVTLAFIVIVVLTLAQIFFRFALDSPLTWSEELARLLTVWLTFIGAAVVSWDGRHLNVDVGFALLPQVGKAIVRVMNAAVAVGLLILLVGPDHAPRRDRELFRTRCAGAALGDRASTGCRRRRSHGGRDFAPAHIPTGSPRTVRRALCQGCHVTPLTPRLETYAWERPK